VLSNNIMYDLLLGGKNIALLFVRGLIYIFFAHSTVPNAYIFFATSLDRFMIIVFTHE